MIEDKLKLSAYLSWTFCSCNTGATHISCRFIVYTILCYYICLFFVLIQERESLIQSSISRLWNISVSNLATVYSLMTGLYLFKLTHLKTSFLT